MKNHALFFVDVLDKGSELRAQHPRERKLFRRCNVDLEAPGHQRCGDLETDEARADDDRRLRALSGVNDLSAIGKRTQVLNTLGTWNPQTDGTRARGE